MHHSAMRVLIALFVFMHATDAVCSFQRGGVNAKWKVRGSQLVIDFVNNDLNDFEFTGIAFGESMEDLEFILFKVVNGRASVVTGATDDYAPPRILDSSPAVSVESLRYSNGKLQARVARPLKAHGPRQVSISGMTRWNFILVGDLEDGGATIGAHRDLPSKVLVDPSQC